MSTCYCDGPAHPYRRDFCGRYPTEGDPTSLIERDRARRRRMTPTNHTPGDLRQVRAAGERSEK